MNAGSGEPISRDLIPFEKYSINATKTLARIIGKQAKSNEEEKLHGLGKYEFIEGNFIFTSLIFHRFI